MSRQSLSAKKVARLARETGLPVVRVLVRGDTRHRRDLCLEDGSIMYLFRDGTMERAPIGWRAGSG